MARVKLTEYQSKKILFEDIGEEFVSFRADIDTTEKDLKDKYEDKKLVVKVDQGVKKRGKLGLIKVGVGASDIPGFIKKINDQGYSSFLVEPLVPHDQKEEKYIAIERIREGIKVSYSELGGIEVEENWDSVEKQVIEYDDITKEDFSSLKEIIKEKKIREFVVKVIDSFQKHYFSYLEINPLVVTSEQIYVLDLAIEIDDTALNTDSNNDINFRLIKEKDSHDAEERVKYLDNNTPASLKLKIINPNGGIWMLLSGGGASLVLADEIADIGKGDDLGNYGEYSGNPTREDTYLYSKIVLEQMLSADSEEKVLIIAGGVANFTDVAKTFAGIIDALDELKDKLNSQGIKVYVRRGGPNQEKGLEQMETFLKNNDLYGFVTGPDLPLTDIIHKAVK